MSLKFILTYLVVKTLTVFFTVTSGLLLLYKRITRGSGYFHIKPRPHPPTLLNDPRFGTHRFVNLPEQGIKLHYVEKGSKDNPLMVCLHGFPECWFTWKSVLEKFSDKHWVVAVDMRGYGASDKPKGIASYKTDLLVEDIREFVQILAKEKKCILMAHDWGGVLGWLVACKYPHLFEKHISLNGPHSAAFDEHAKSSFSQMMKSWYTFFFQSWYLPEIFIGAKDLSIFRTYFQRDIKAPNKLSDEEVEVYKYYFSQPDALTPPINYYRNLLTNVKDGERQVCKVNSLIVWGVNDMFLERGIADKTHRYCEKLQIDYINDCGHFVLLEKTEEVHQAIWKFLEK